MLAHSSWVHRHAAASLLVAAAACSGGGTGTTTTTGGAGSGGHTASTSSSHTGTGGDDILFDGGGDDGGILSGCATASAKAKPQPLDLYIMLDQSGSMIGAKWAAVTHALDTFVKGQGVADLGVGLQYFPLSGAQVCDYTAYGAPAVPIAPLAQSGPAVSQSLTQHVPAGETPTLSAIQGALAYSKGWATSHPKHTVVVVLATDGEPNVCGSTVANVGQAAQVGFSTAPSIRTFVIGVGTTLSSLDQVAAAGGTGKVILVDDANSTEQQFIAALETIRGTALPCEYDIPPPPVGSTLDYGKVNVVFTPGGGQATVIPQVQKPADCGAKPNSWYYDDPAAPAQVVFCDAMCTQLKGQSDAAVDVVFGCATQIAQ